MALSSSIPVWTQTTSLGVTSLLCILHLVYRQLTATDRRMMVHTLFRSCWSINSEAHCLSVICCCCLFIDKISIVETLFNWLCVLHLLTLSCFLQIEPVEFSLDWLVNHFLLSEEPQVCVSSYNQVCVWGSYWMVCLTTESRLYVSHKCCEMRAYIKIFLRFFMKFFQRNHIVDHQ